MFFLQLIVRKALQTDYTSVFTGCLNFYEKNQNKTVLVQNYRAELDNVQAISFDCTEPVACFQHFSIVLIVCFE